MVVTLGNRKYLERINIGYKIGYTKLAILFIMHGEVYIFCSKMISTLWGLTYKNIGKMANKLFNIPNHLNEWGQITRVGAPEFNQPTNQPTTKMATLQGVKLAKVF